MSFLSELYFPTRLGKFTIKAIRLFYVIKQILKNPSDPNLSSSTVQLIILMMKIRKLVEKGNTNYFASYDTAVF